MWAAFSQGVLVLAIGVCLGWILVLARIWRTVGTFGRLTAMPAAPGGVPLRVSAVLAAGSSARALERTVRSLLAQEGVQMQVVVVSNGAPAIHAVLDPLANTDARLLVLRNDKLPRGWIAKNYALELGQGRADGDYLLFTEPDVFHGRRAVHSALRHMEEERLDHLAVHPRLEAGSWLEALVLPLYVLVWEFRFMDPAAARPDSGVGAGVAAFNLVRAEAYRLRGTHARIRSALLDDRALGRMMRVDGGRGTMVRAVSQVRTRPYRSFADLYAGIRMGTLVSARESPWTAFVMGGLLSLGGILPPLLLTLGLPLWWAGEGPWTMLIALVTLALPTTGLMKARTMVRFEPMAAALFPLGALLIGLSTMHGALQLGTRGRILWRGHAYAREELRDAVTESF